MTPANAHLVARLRELARASPTPGIGPPRKRSRASRGRDAVQPRARTLRVNLETLDRILDLTGEITVEAGPAA